MIPVLDIASPTGVFRIRLRPGDMRLGRATDCDIYVRDKLVSARHAVFSVGEDGKVKVRDLGSTNGIYVNGVRRAEVGLKSGDTVRAGGTIVTYVEEPDSGGESGTTTHHAMDVIEKGDQTGFDPFSITVGVDEIVADLHASQAESASAATIVARTRLSLLQRLAQGATIDAELDHLLLHIAQVVREGIGPERIAILVSDKEGAPAVRRFARDWRKPGDDQNVYVPRLIVATAMYERKALLFHDIPNDPRFKDETRISGLEIRQAMSAPILFGGTVRGAIYIDRSRPEPPFTAEELYLLGIIAYQSGAVLQNQETFSRERHALGELRRTQEELIHATRLATIGELLAGVANEINNPVAAIIGFCDLALSQEDCPTPLRSDLEQIRIASVRLKQVLSQLLAFSRRTPGGEGAFNISRAVRDVLELRQRELGKKGVNLQIDFLSGIPPVAGDMNQIQQVVLCLVNNAEQALEGRRPDGKIVVRGRCDHARAYVTVEDNGPGIAPDVLPRIFDPFFTTRPAGRGAGLGLTIALAIAEHHRGKLTVESEPGKGAKFTLELPLKPGAPTAPDETAALAALPRMALTRPPTPVPAAPSDPGRPTTRKRVLVVDDEAAVRDLMARALEKSGFEAVRAASMREALDVLRDREIDFIVTDILLGGADGIELAERAVGLKPALVNRVLFVTGDDTTERCREAMRNGAEVLPKPFDLSDLSARVALRLAGVVGA